MLNVTGIPGPVLSINGSDSYLQLLPQQSCITNLGQCNTGFTVDIDVNFNQLLDNTFIVSSGGHLANHQGISLLYIQDHLIYVVSSPTYTWSLEVNYKPVLNQWQHIELTWNKHLGIELFINGQSMGSITKPSPNTGTQKTPLCIACSHGTGNSIVNMLVTGLMVWSNDRTGLVNAGLKPGLFSYKTKFLIEIKFPYTLTDPLSNYRCFVFR